MISSAYSSIGKAERFDGCFRPVASPTSGGTDFGIVAACEFSGTLCGSDELFAARTLCTSRRHTFRGTIPTMVLDTVNNLFPLPTFYFL